MLSPKLAIVDRAHADVTLAAIYVGTLALSVAYWIYDSMARGVSQALASRNAAAASRDRDGGKGYGKYGAVPNS
jgi:hypothetical protein